MRLRDLDRPIAIGLHAIAALVVLVVLALLGDLLRRGIGLIDLEFLTAAPRDAGRSGGIGPILLSTAAIVGVCLAAVVPLGLGTALFMTDVLAPDGRTLRILGRIIDVLAGVPSIVFGLFGSAAFCVGLGMGFSILAGGLTLACAVLPLFTRLAEQSLRAVPPRYRQAATSLGFSRASIALRIVLPTALPALAGALILSLGRALAETAALLFTSGSVARTPESLLDPGRALSVHIYEQAMHVPGGDAGAAASAVVLVTMVILVALVVRGWERWWAKRLGGA